VYVKANILVSAETGTVDQRFLICGRNRKENRKTGEISRAGKTEKSGKINLSPFSQESREFRLSGSADAADFVGSVRAWAFRASTEEMRFIRLMRTFMIKDEIKAR
jgi:hypothetical protein